MAGPTITGIAAQAGTLQSVVSPKRTDDTKKESDSRRLPAGGDDDDDSKQTGKAGKPGGTGKATGAQAGQEGKRVRRKKVSLDQLTSKQTEKTSKKEQTSDVRGQSEAQGTDKAQAQSDAADTKALGYAKAASKLNEQSKMVQASVKHEQAQRENPQPELSAAGRKRGMLGNLVNWTGINHAQHTGDKAGEAYNRRGAREAHMALKGLFNGNTSGSSSTTGTSTSDRLAAKGVKYDQHKLENVQRFHAEEQPPESGYEAFEATG